MCCDCCLAYFENRNLSLKERTSLGFLWSWNVGGWQNTSTGHFPSPTVDILSLLEAKHVNDPAWVFMEESEAWQDMSEAVGDRKLLWGFSFSLLTEMQQVAKTGTLQFKRLPQKQVSGLCQPFFKPTKCKFPEISIIHPVFLGSSMAKLKFRNTQPRLQTEECFQWHITYLQISSQPWLGKGEGGELRRILNNLHSYGQQLLITHTL